MAVFDVDGTLIDDFDQPRDEIIDFLKACKSVGFRIGVWSGGGRDYATMWTRRLGIEEIVDFAIAKERSAPPGTTFCVDDVYGTKFGVPTLYVGPEV